ncbi:MAG TPA: peptidylprolyl isomerase [Candidatus Nanoarchaeia archaeon]|nr:peptidylprolyl isomerase [Candidatus Nanoarchaeia archaeon]
MSLKKHDFVELDYTASLEDGTVFDTTIESVAREHRLENSKPKPVIVCIGESQVVKGLDDALIDKKPEGKFSIKLNPDQAFGKKDVKLIKLIPMSTFQKQKVMPQPGLRVNIDGIIATVMRVGGGRVLVDHNHPLANKIITYDVTLRKKITDKKQQIESYLAHVLPLPCTVKVNENSATIETDQKLPKELTKTMSEKLSAVVGISAEFTQKAKKSDKDTASS